jgi:glycine betaine/proline transport system substrate-binding protein
MGAMLVYMDDQQAAGEDAAYEFLARYPDVWTKWVSKDVAAKVKAAL